MYREIKSGVWERQAKAGHWHRVGKNKVPSAAKKKTKQDKKRKKKEKQDNYTPTSSFPLIDVNFQLLCALQYSITLGKQDMNSLKTKTCTGCTSFLNHKETFIVQL